MDGLPKEVVEYIKELENKIIILTETLAAMQKKQFGQSSEKSSYILNEEEQTHLFNEAEVCADESVPEEVVIKSYKRKPKRTKEELAEILPVETVIIDIPEENCTCNICENELQPIGREFVRRELNIIPARAYIEEIYRVNYSCTNCEKETDESNIIKSPVPEPVIKRGLASASSVAHVIYQKFVNSIPLFRQEKDWENQGVIISRATLANWIIYVSLNWFMPLYFLMKSYLIKLPVIGADETVTQVLNEDGKTPQSQSRMWVYCSGDSRDPPIYLYEYQPTRSGEHAKEFLTGFTGFLITDGYAGYNCIEDVTRCGCWAHQRRKYEEALPKGKNKASKAAKGLEYCNKLFELEREFRDLSFEVRHEKRNELSKPVLEAYYSWLKTINPLEGSKLAKAVNYSYNQADELKAFLLDGRIEISNNRAENAIRPYVIGRKNWLFSATVRGAKSSAVCYSLIETAKANNLNPYKYLLYLLTNLPTIIKSGNTDSLNQFLPWADEIPDYCRIEEK